MGKRATKSKVQLSCNLHNQLPRDMDLFVLLSSLAGLYGSLAQSNYAAGSTFQDALASCRTSIGMKSFSFDLGIVRDVGIVADREDYQKSQNQSFHMKAVELQDPDESFRTLL